MKKIYIIFIVSFLLSPIFLGLESEQTGIPQSHYAKQSSIINMKSSSEVDQISTDILSSSKTISSVTITKPHQGYLYIFNKEIIPIGFTCIIGKITIEVESSEDVDGIDIYIDNELRFSDTSPPYSRVWDDLNFGWHVITAVAKNGNISDEVRVFIINRPHQEKKQVVINEILSDPVDDDSGREWIELYNPGENLRINGWTISNADGSAIAMLPNWMFPNDCYLVVNFGEGINDDDFSDGNATFFVGDLTERFDNVMDECALYTGLPSANTIIDFVSYSLDDSYEPGVAYNYATSAGIWDEYEFFSPFSDIFEMNTRGPMLEEGDSIGRDAESNDINFPTDWDISGGKDAFSASPGRCNLDAYGIVNVEISSFEIPTTLSKEWTVMVYMADCNLEDDFWRQLNQLENVGTNSDMNIVFEIDGWKNTSELYLDAGTWKPKNQGQAFRGFLMKDNTHEIVNWGRTKINTSSFVWAYTPPGQSACIGEINTGDDAPLRDFINWAKANAPANHYILILGGHGAGWKGLMVDENSNDDWLYMGELDSALRGSPNGISLIGFDCCYMANIEVAYQIRDWVQYMVASEEVDRGWNYQDIFGYLQNNIDVSASTLAQYMVESYRNKYKDWLCHTLSAIDLGRLGPIYGGVRQLASHLEEGMEDWGDEEDQPFKNHGNPSDNCQIDVKNSLFNAEHYGDRNYVDLYDLVNLIGNNHHIYESYKQPWEQILDGINGLGGAVIKNTHGNNHPFSYGLSIYFPRNETDHTKFKNCGGKNRTDHPFDNPWPSRIKTPGDDPAIYAIDETTAWGKVPYVGVPPHPWDETPNFLWRDEGIKWDEFLHRYYKPCADAGADVSAEVEPGQLATIQFDGRGSSSADDDGIIHEYWWDYDIQVNSDNGDWDKDGNNEYNDDKDGSGPTPTFEFSPGTYVVTLTVWDDHHLKNEPRCNDFPNEHWKTDQDTVVVTVVEKPSDDEPPETTIIEPPDGYESLEDFVVMQGVATDNVGVVLFGYHLEWGEGTVDDAWEVDNLNMYNFDFDLHIYPGYNDITVYAKDAAGNEGTDSVRVLFLG